MAASKPGCSGGVVMEVASLVVVDGFVDDCTSCGMKLMSLVVLVVRLF